MNEEIARILQLLEAGKVNADEAERLIKAVTGPSATAAGPGDQSATEAGTESTAEVCPNPFRDIEHLVRTVTRAYRSGMKRHRRFEQWRWHEYRRQQQDERRQRAESQPINDRVRHVLQERAFVDPDAALEELDDIARNLMRYELEEEFGIEIPRDDLETIGSLEALVTYIQSRVPETKPPSEPGTPPPPETPARSPRGRKRRAKEDIPAG